MTDCRTSQESYCKRTTETRLVTVSFNDDLDTNETLIGTPTVVESTLLGLTITNKTINTSSFNVDGKTIGIGKAVQFLVAGGLIGDANINITVSTSSTPAQILNGSINLENA